MSKTVNFQKRRLSEQILSQAAELYVLGIQVETERQKLLEVSEQYGFSSPITAEQYERVSRLLRAFDEMENRHISMTEQYAGIGKGSAS